MHWRQSKDVIYDKNMLTLEECVEITDHDFENADYMLQYVSARAPKYGNDQCRKQDADRIAELNDKVRKIYGDIMSNESMVAYNEAKNEVDQLMQYINAILVTAVNGGDPMTVEEPSSCGGDCAGCSGCH